MARPSKYKPEYNEQAYKLSLLGLTDIEMAAYFDVAESTFNLWKKDKEGFSEALKQGKQEADGEVAQSLYDQAKSGNVTACIFWLKNRHPDKWRDKVEQVTTHNMGEIPEEFL